jgi:hypothetical protein
VLVKRISLTDVDSQSPRALPEGGFATFEDVAYLGPDLMIFEPAAHVVEFWGGSIFPSDACGDYHLIDVCIYDQVSIVGNDDHLTTEPSLAKKTYELGVN